MSEIITSAGQIGADYNRSEGRAYFTEAAIICDPKVILERISNLRSNALTRGRRRWVYRAIFDGELEEWPLLEVNIPLSLLDQTSTRRLIIFAENVHRSEVSEWESIYNFWQKPYPREIDPLTCIRGIIDQFDLIKTARESDVVDLAEIWGPFGWKVEGVREFLNIQNQPNIWFSGIVERTSGRLVSACQGEGICFGETMIVESTEFGTHSQFEGRGLCTAAVVGLNAQILRDTTQLSTRFPLIYSELSMTTRSDVVARKAGMTIPLVEGQRGLQTPTQVLRRNVSVLDSKEPNDLSLDELGSQARYFRKAYGQTYPYWRNFIAGVLSRESIDRYYSTNQCREILDYYD